MQNMNLNPLYYFSSPHPCCFLFLFCFGGFSDYPLVGLVKIGKRKQRISVCFCFPFVLKQGGFYYNLLRKMWGEKESPWSGEKHRLLRSEKHKRAKKQRPGGELMPSNVAWRGSRMCLFCFVMFCLFCFVCFIVPWIEPRATSLTAFFLPQVSTWQ